MHFQAAVKGLKQLQNLIESQNINDFICLCIYSGAALTGYQYCSRVSAVLKRTHDKYFNFTTARAVCHGQGGTLLTPETYNSHCASELLDGTYRAWLDKIVFRSAGDYAHTTRIGGERYPTSSLDTPLYVVCQFCKLCTAGKGFVCQI